MNTYSNFIKDFQRAVLAAGRDAEEIDIVAVSEKKPIGLIDDIYKLGHRSFGENQIQEVENKWIGYKKKSKDLKLHFVGAIQSRKTKSILNYCDVIHSIDRMKIVKLIKDYEKYNETANKKYFIQVNIGNEDQKSGVMMDDIDLFIEDCKSKYELRIEGLMCLPPINEDPTRHFNNLKHIATNHNLTSLSMGMSQDFREAIKCGSTHIRIGTQIFGPRN